MKLNVDASWAAATGNGHAGVITRNDDGLFVAARKLKIKAPSAAAAEAKTILYNCELAMGMEMIIVESDSKENLSCLLDASITGSWEAFPTLVKIMRLGESFQACCWSWVLRSANMAANRLASKNNTEMSDST